MTPEQAQAIQIGHAFLRAFDGCCGLVSPPAPNLPDPFLPCRGRLRQHLSLFGPETAGEAFAAWNLEWQQETYDACTAIGDRLDGHGDTPPAALEAFQAMLPLAGLAEIRPPLNALFSLEEHNLAGTLPLTGPPSQGGRIAGVRRRGYRRGDRVLRKADVHIYDQPILPPAPPPAASNRSALLTLFLAAIVALFAFLLWKDTSKPASFPSNVAVDPAGPANPLRPKRVAITHFTVQPAQVSFGQPVTVSWEVANAATVRITPWPGNVESWGTTRFIPSEDTAVIVLEAKGAGDANAAREERPIHVVRLAVNPVVEFSADRSQVPFGESVTLRWSAPAGAALRIDPAVPGFDPARPRGQVKVTLERNAEYALTARGLLGATTKTVAVHVVPRIAVFEAVPNALDHCKVSVLRWTVLGASTLSIEPGIGQIHSPYRVVRPQRTTRYTLTAEGPGGSSSSEVTVSVVPGPGPACGPT